MKVHVRWSFVVVYIALMCIVNSFAGFAGFFSFWISVIGPFYALFAILYLIFSWIFYAWTQDISTDHPKKGEVINFKIRFTNESFFPLIGGICKFVLPGSFKEFLLPVGFFPKSPKVVNYTTDVVCPYRGTYIAGIKSIQLSTPLKIIQTEMEIIPQKFYVLPELISLSTEVNAYTISSGSSISGGTSGADDISAFEYTIPLQKDSSGQLLMNGRIAWKKWASSGIPCGIISGKSRSTELTIILDLYSVETKSINERLAAEDMIISAAFSLLLYLAKNKTPVTFVIGSSDNGIYIDNEDSFKSSYEHSINIMFDDLSFPYNAFNKSGSCFLFSTRSLMELYTEYEKSLRSSSEPHLFLCPPESSFETENKAFEVIRKQRDNFSSRSMFYIANVKNGSKEIIDAFKS